MIANDALELGIVLTKQYLVDFWLLLKANAHLDFGIVSSTE